jgi:tRNA nucleotidyltransferase/poly(A) polymerase
MGKNMRNLFADYVYLREETGQKPSSSESVTSRIKLQKKEGSKDFGPFVINKNNHANLKFLVKAFLESDKVGLGYTTIDKSKGEIEPQLKKKSLYLTGGAVRDHLKGKTPRNYDLVTDATASEVRLILTNAGFTETKPRGDHSLKGDLPTAGTKNKIFYVTRKDKKGKELEFTVEVNGEKFELASFSKCCKSRKVQPDDAETAASIEEDSQNRDFTINSLYIPLTNADGDNSDLIDPHGGANHLQGKEVKAVRNEFGKRLEEDPSTALKYIRFVSKYGNADQMPKDYIDLILKHKDLSNVSKEDIRDEFLSGLENIDVDPKKYLSAYKNTGLLGSVLPDASFDEEDVPEDFKGDRWLSSAYLLKDKDSDEVKNSLIEKGWSKQEASDIAYLVKLYQWSKKGFDSKDFYDLKHLHNGLTKGKLKDWLAMSKIAGPEIDSFLDHDDSDLTPYVSGEGKRTVNPEFVKILGRVPQGHEFESVKRSLSTKKWKDLLDKGK